MGIKGLTKLLNDEAPGCIKEAELSNYTGRKVAIDASMALYQFLIAIRSGTEGYAAQVLTNEAGEVTSHIQGIFNRTIRMLTNGIKPVFVFDGKPPTMKSGELAKRQARRSEAEAKLAQAETAEDKEKYEKRLTRVTRQHAEDTKELLRLMGVPVVQAPCEAEAQCAELAVHGKVWATGTEDMDALCFRTPKLLRKLTFGSTKQPVMEVDYEKAIRGLGLSHQQFIDLCILCGCDYTDTIKGIGPKTALKLVKEHGSLEAVVRHLRRNPGKKKYDIPQGWLPPSERDAAAAKDDSSGSSSESKEDAIAAERGDSSEAAATPAAEDKDNAPAAEGEENAAPAANQAEPAAADAEDDAAAAGKPSAAAADAPAEGKTKATSSDDATAEAKEELPEFAQARGFFVTPEVTPAAQIDLQWTACDEGALRAFLVDRMGFATERVDSGIRRLQESRKMSAQARMDSFFRPSGTISSKTGASKRKAAAAAAKKNKKSKSGRRR